MSNSCNSLNTVDRIQSPIKMKKGKKIQVRRTFDVALKKSVVKEYEQNKFTVKQLSKLYKVSVASIYKWIYRYSTYNEKMPMIVEVKNSSMQKLKEYENRIAELERMLGQKQINIEYLEKVIDIADEHYETDLKKNSAIKP